MTYDRAELLALIRLHALKFGDFTLASGQKASFYLDCKQVTLAALGAVQVGAGLLERLRAERPAAVGGMSIGADPITAAVVTLAGLEGWPLVGFMVRKEPKGHGTNRYLEGPVVAGQEAVIVEDVVTTGGSSLLAIERAREYGLVVKRVLAIIDREQGGAAAFAAQGVQLESLFSIREVVQVKSEVGSQESEVR